MTTKIIELVIGDVGFDVEVQFTFTKGYPAKTNALPENCYPEEPDEWELESLNVVDDKTKYPIDILIDALHAEIIEKLYEKLEEEAEE